MRGFASQIRLFGDATKGEYNMRHLTSRYAAVIAGSLLMIGLARHPAPAETILVNAQSNIYGAGHTTPPNPGGGGGGLLPNVISLVPGYEKVLVFSSVTGTVMSWPGDPGNGPDGYYQLGNHTVIDSYGGISETWVCDLKFFLAGVCLDYNEPVDPPPDYLLICGYSLQNPEFSPELRQVFYIGDGLTGTGSGVAQVFHLPSSATRLYLGFADGYFQLGLPGFYGDNTGSLTASYNVYSLAPISKFTLTPASVKGGRKVKGQIQLSVAAPSGGVLIYLASNNWAAVIPSTVIVPAGKKSVNFQIATTKVPISQKAKIQAWSTNTVSKTLKITK